MTAKQLQYLVDRSFDTRRAFVAAFNAAAGKDAKGRNPLNETTLSRQITGKIAVSGGFAAAYTFFQIIDAARRTSEYVDGLSNETIY